MKEKEIRFEEGKKELEALIEKLEDGGIPLDESLETYEKAVKLIKILNKQLEAAENKITILSKDIQGNLKEIPFDNEQGENDE